ncbi:MAG TPA: dihydrodipicolinate synthase family protein, partial [Acidobacteriota bacterium]|nr:dihydrodipicolinate synthase family protein [Acidobacteriota bacterium]
METTRRDEVTRLEGIIPAILTPFTGQGTVDLATLRRLVRFLMESQVGGFYVNGSTGEWSKLTIEERKAIAETVVSEVDGRVPGHFNGAFALDLARHAKAIGADIVSSVFPSPDASRNEIIRYYCSLASVGLPVIVYYLERQDGWGNFTENFLSIFGTIDRVEGVKYTGKDLYAMYCIHYLSEGRLTVWSGYDQMALAGLIMGAKGVIGANYNYIPEIYVAMYRAYRSGDLARAQELQ